MGGQQERKEFHSSQEYRKDLEWIEENRAIFWLVATVACEQTGSGAIVVDLSKTSIDRGHLFRYITQGEIEIGIIILIDYCENTTPIGNLLSFF